MGGSAKSAEFTAVVIVYDHGGSRTLTDPFPHDTTPGAHEPEILQCVIEDGKLIKIDWKAIDGREPNRKGLIRYVTKTYK
jgi:hypothetical protein